MARTSAKESQPGFSSKVYSFFEVWWSFLIELLTVVTSIIALFQFGSPDAPVIVLASFMFVLSVMNVVFSTSAQKLKVKLKENQHIIDKDVEALELVSQLMERLKDYRDSTKKLKKDPNANETLVRDHLHSTLKEVCGTFLKYMGERYGKDLNFALKYIHRDELKSIRLHASGNPRADDPEKISDCELFRIFFRTGKKKSTESLLHIKDVNNLSGDDHDRLDGLGPMIIKRAQDRGYATFIAVPVKSGNLNYNESPSMKTPLGFFGFDLPKAGDFGEITVYEREILRVFSSLVSELLFDFDPESEEVLLAPYP